MPFTLREFCELRPFLYHVTERSNLPRLLRSRMMEPAAELIRRSGNHEWTERRRREPVAIEVDGETVVLKDQRPLIFANATLEGGWTERDFIRYLNEHVFFWPGTEAGSIKHGARLLARYEQSAPAVLRMGSREAFAANPERTPLFCPFNSGALRKQNGAPVARGPGLFAPAHNFPRPARAVVEVVVHGAVRLPDTTCVATSDGTWTPLSQIAPEEFQAEARPS